MDNNKTGGNSSTGEVQKEYYSGQNEEQSGITLNKICGFIILLTAFFAVLQFIFMLTLPENTMLEMGKAVAKVQRDSKNPPRYLINKTDADIDLLIENNKSKFIQAVKKESVKRGIIKIILAICLLVIGIGVLQLKRSPARILAIIVGIIMLIGVIIQFSKGFEILKVYGRFDAPFLIVIMDYAWSILLPLATVACFVTFKILKSYD